MKATKYTYTETHKNRIKGSLIDKIIQAHAFQYKGNDKNKRENFIKELNPYIHLRRLMGEYLIE